MKKYEFTGVEKNGLKQIVAVRDFGSVEEGDIGGWIEKEENLSHEGGCWVHGNVLVSGNAHVYGNAQIYGDARVSGDALVYGDVQVYGNSRIYGYACVYGYAQVFEHARVYGNALIRENAHVYGNAHVFEYAQVFGDSCVHGNTKIQLQQHVKFGHVTTDLLENLYSNITAQTGLIPEEDHVICYKRVNKDLSSEFDSDFVYKVGVWNEAADWEEGHASCAPGLHVSNGTYYPKIKKTVILKCKVMLDDIITVQEGKIRCKKLFVEKIAY